MLMHGNYEEQYLHFYPVVRVHLVALFHLGVPIHSKKNVDVLG